jgi:small nuclear ribonucleoprotein (snRNP)-like protein
MSVAKRKFVGEIGMLIDRTVMVITVDGKKYSGTLSGIDPDTLSLSLSDAKDEKGATTHKVFLDH